MRSPRPIATAAVGLALIAAMLISFTGQSAAATPLIGVVRATEVHVEPEVTGQLAEITVEKGAHVHAGDVVARLSAVELTAQVAQARAALAAAVANRNNVYAGVRREEVDTLKNEIAKATARRDFLELQLTRAATLASQNFESQQTLDQAENDAAGARADVAAAQANYDAAIAGPTKEERGIADTEVQAREDHLAGLSVGDTVDVVESGAAGPIKAVVTEMHPLGVFATWQAERVIGDHDRNTLRLRLDPQGDAAGLEPGMTVWIAR
jgi:HlyD family secretion protein